MRAGGWQPSPASVYLALNASQAGSEGGAAWI